MQVPLLFAGLRTLQIYAANAKTGILGLKRTMLAAVIPRYSWFLSPRIVKTANSKGRLYIFLVCVKETDWRKTLKGHFKYINYNYGSPLDLFRFSSRNSIAISHDRTNRL